MSFPIHSPVQNPLRTSCHIESKTRAHWRHPVLSLSSATRHIQPGALSPLSTPALISSCVPDAQQPPLPKMLLPPLLSRPTPSAVSFPKPSQVPSVGTGVCLPHSSPPTLYLNCDPGSIDFWLAAYYVCHSPVTEFWAHILFIFHPQHLSKCFRLVAFNLSKCQNVKKMFTNG